MSGSGVCILFGLSCMLSVCYGTLYPPANGTRFTYLKGSTARISWRYEDVTDILARAWFFQSSNGSREELIAILPPQPLNRSLPRVNVEEPATLILQNVTEKYNGTYRFHLAATGGGSSGIVVYIAVTPSVSISCSHVNTVNTSDNFSCACRGEGGNPPANVTWYKGNKFMDTGIVEAKLKLFNVTKLDNGNYTCVAKSHEKAKNETEIELIVILKPNVTTNCSSALIVNEGDDVICECKCEDGNPPAECTWYDNDGKTVKKGLKLNALLTLRNVSEQDRGKYKCVGSSHTARNETSINVKVNFKPKNTRIEFSMNPAVINGSVNVTCTSDGYPVLNYAFSHNDTDLNSTGNVYVIHKVTWKDAGMYNCTANNTLGNDSDSKMLTVVRELKSSSAIMASSTIMPSPTVMPSLKTPAPTNTTTSSSTPKETSPDDDSDEMSTGAIAGATFGGVALLVIVAGVVIYIKCKGRDNQRDPNDPKDPNGSKVIVNHYEMEEDQVEGGGNTYDTAKPPDGSGEGSHNNAEHNPPESSPPPVYASVNRENRQGNTLYASLDSEAVKRPSQKKPAENQPKNAPTEYASIDFMKTAKTPNDDSVST